MYYEDFLLYESQLTSRTFSRNVKDEKIFFTYPIFFWLVQYKCCHQYIQPFLFRCIFRRFIIIFCRKSISVIKNSLSQFLLISNV